MSTPQQSNSAEVDHFGSRPVVPTNHAEWAWMKRVDSSGSLKRKIKRAFRDGVPVGHDHGKGKARLYPPRGVVLVYVDGEDSFGRSAWIVTTVLVDFDAEQFTDEHLTECPECELRHDRGHSRPCPWCSHVVRGDSE